MDPFETGRPSSFVQFPADPKPATPRAPIFFMPRAGQIQRLSPGPLRTEVGFCQLPDRHPALWVVQSLRRISVLSAVRVVGYSRTKAPFDAQPPLVPGPLLPIDVFWILPSP